MNPAKSIVLTTGLTAAFLFASATPAMEIIRFDKMAGSDQDAYIADLVEGARRVLDQAGRTTDALAVHRLFTTNADNGVSVGMNKFMIYLALVRVTDPAALPMTPDRLGSSLCARSG